MTLTARRSFGIGSAAALAIGAAVLLAAPASAHTPTLSAACVGGQTTLTIDLKDYNGKQSNTVTATVKPAGAAQATTLVDTKFQDSYDAKFNDAKTIPSDVADTFVVTVKAWDDANGKNGWSFTKTLTSEACTKTTPPPTTTTTTTTTTTSATPTTTTTAPSTTTSAVAVTPTTTVTSVENTALANTGVNSGVMIGIAAALLLLGGGLLFALRLAARRR